MQRHATWWDLDNVSSFFHSLGHHACALDVLAAPGVRRANSPEVFILSMPLVGVNFDHRSSNFSDHWWFQPLGCKFA